VSNVRSSLHTVLVTDVDTDASGAATSPTLAIRRLRLSPTGDCRLNRDFILRFNVTNPGTSDGITSSLVLSDDLDGDSKEGTWQLTMVAPRGGGTAPGNAPRDVAFVIDRSGSMDGWKMVAARSATTRVVSVIL
jgi:Ca-activated chloride channel family protein